MAFLNTLMNTISTFRITDLIDILVIAYAVYKIILLVKETRAEQLIKGFLALLIFSQVSGVLNLYTVNWVINNLFTVGLILVIVVFQPELRRIFERIGRTQGWFKPLINQQNEESERRSNEIVNAVGSLSRQKMGALIVIENAIGLTDYVETGTEIDGLITSELLINIFIPNTPLHDGAVIIKEDKIRAAGCFLPLTDNKTLSRELGTRHRAALGLTERSDALVIIVSEETGIVSIAQEGEISRRIDTESLRELLTKFYDAQLSTGFFGKGGAK